LLAGLITFVLGWGLLSNLVLGFTLNTVWSVINGIQIAVYYPLFHLTAPDNLGIV